MRSLFYMASFLAVIGLAYWAYYENYRTQAAIAHAETLERQIADNRQRLRVLNAEWAYQNRPDRLRELAEINFDRLGLVPLKASQFGRVDQVPYPPSELEGLIDLSKSVDVSSEEEPL
ncbi:cell division protein FtsL [Roseovarius sp. LXJ103]|uniref:cell division protein FtsL n=1 Tax=Roseovarius carneus TaxID=2853164 RepID=UPI000D60FA7F|nr:cell division protein FtsL [Roseovarius carneus]MBZ8118889.1 cell division protein FtsL [Roseovarius carneus]PWE35451.1 cell division protein FtsL [Pelagicola sp. LXJ1103]